MSRPFDWTPLAAGDPIPGDPDLVEQAGQDYRLVAQAIETAASRLRTIAADVSMQSDAVAQIRERADGLAQQVGRAQERYEAIGVALLGYARVLSDAQVSALKALRMAQGAHADQVLARYAGNNAQARIDSVVLDPTAHGDLFDARRREETAAGEIVNAQAILERAVQYRDEAAEAARRIIDAAKSHDGLNDSRWDNFKAALVSTLKSVSEVVDMVAISAGVLALLFSPVPFVGEFFAAVALVASIASLALKLTLMAFGEGSWLEIGIAALGVATFGVGKVAIGSSEFAGTGARAYARLAAGRAAAEAPAVRAARGLPPLSSSSRTVEILMGSGNNMSRSVARETAALNASRGAKAAWSEGLASLRDVPAETVADLKGIRQFDLRSPVAQVKGNTPMHPLSFLGERSAAAESQSLERIHGALRGGDLVAEQLRTRRIAIGAFVATWVAGNGLLVRDTLNFVHGGPAPTSPLP